MSDNIKIIKGNIFNTKSAKLSSIQLIVLALWEKGIALVF